MRDKDGSNTYGQPGGVRPSPLWWIGQLILTGTACFFVFFGISLLLAAYRLNDPFSFIMTFFAASLIILISAVLVLGFVMRAIRMMQATHPPTHHDVDR